MSRERGLILNDAVRISGRIPLAEEIKKYIRDTMGNGREVPNVGNKKAESDS